MKKIMKVAIVAAMALAMHGASVASVVISGTRVVFPSNEKEVTIRLSNEGQQPGLVQVWLDEGDPQAAPEHINVPFVLTPPMFRIEPGKGQTVRMLYNQSPLPQDRESVYWLNMLEVPPKPEDGDANYIQMAFRTRIKVFFRPKELNQQEKVQEAAGRLKWSLARTADGKSYTLEVSNPTPYHVSFMRLSVGAPNGKSAVNEDGGMVEPGKSASFALQGGESLSSGALKVKYTWLNDYGAGVEGEAEVAK
ncbi:molecular chaperone [Herbaspirillum chlorophenolicum]|uniref:Molecular chaperone n=1 Tax=Herbaspirillum chlorophenolicum TaxID=211589 RepID=A0ABW8EWC5_9BURK